MEVNMRRPQFSVRSLLWLTAVVAAFFAGRENGWKGHRKYVQGLYSTANKSPHMTAVSLERLLEAAARNREKELAGASAQPHKRKKRPQSQPATARAPATEFD
jgi:hypothetical protein